MSFALKPINPRIQQVLEEKSKILSRDTAALKIQAGGMSAKLKEMQSRSTWIRWISGDKNPIVILGGVAHYDGAYNLAKGFDHYITIETEGSEAVGTCADLISLSPKLSNSTPRPGTWMPYLNRTVTEQDKEKHEKWRCNYEAMRLLLDLHPDYQLKPVISEEKDLEEVKELQKELGVPNKKVYLMPEGINKEQVESRRKWLSELCQKEGYNFTDRLHILIYGDQRGV